MKGQRDLPLSPAWLTGWFRACRLPIPKFEYRFHPDRKWRADICYPDLKLMIEIHGGNWVGGKHVRPAGFRKDREKIAAAQTLGYIVLEFQPEDFHKTLSALPVIESAIASILTRRNLDQTQSQAKKA